MFFSIKDSTFSQKDKRRLDRQESERMEQRLEEALARQKQEEIRAATDRPISRSRIETPGVKRPNSSIRRMGTPALRKRMGL